MTRLPQAFLTRPLAHRGLHDLSLGRPENSFEAMHAAAAAGYGIELDVQVSQDGIAMVFHDKSLERLTGETGLVRDRSAEALTKIPLLGGDPSRGIPRLSEIISAFAASTPLLIEIKDQSGDLGPGTGSLERAVAEAISQSSHTENIAVMSFNTHSVAIMKDLLPDLPRGLTTEEMSTENWPNAPAARRAHLSDIRDYQELGCCFVSHNHRHLAAPRIAALKSQGAAILCWTINSEAEERAARKIADNITFEGYMADNPCA